MIVVHLTNEFTDFAPELRDRSYLYFAWRVWDR